MLSLRDNELSGILANKMVLGKRFHTTSAIACLIKKRASSFGASYLLRHFRLGRIETTSLGARATHCAFTRLTDVSSHLRRKAKINLPMTNLVALAAEGESWVTHLALIRGWETELAS